MKDTEARQKVAGMQQEKVAPVTEENSLGNSPKQQEGREGREETNLPFTDFHEQVETLFARFGIAAANEIFRVYLSLSDTEKDRVYHFTMDAQTRDKNERARIDYQPVETFLDFLSEVATGATVDKVCELLEMTPFECDRLTWAWEAMRDVEQAVQERVKAKYGEVAFP